MSAHILEVLGRQKTTATVRLDAYAKQLLDLFKEMGIPESDWEARFQQTWNQVVGTMQEEVTEEKRRVRTLTRSIDEKGRRLLLLADQLGREVEEPDENLSLLGLERTLLQRLHQLEAERDKLVAILRPLREEEEALCSRLGMEPLALTFEVPRDVDFREVAAHVAMLKAERQRRSASFQALRERLVKLLESLECASQTEVETQAILSPEQFSLSQGSLASLESVVRQREEEDKQNREEVDQLRNRLDRLWTRLEVAEDHRASFMASCTGHGPTCLRLLRQEVDRHEQLKRQNIEKFVRALRKEIVELWDRCYCSESQRAAFAPFRDEIFTEQLLEEHEAEQERLKKYYELNRVLIKDVDEHQKLWNKMLELEERATDPARYANRGGQLLMEERERKKIARRLPKVESDLQQLIQMWEERHNCTFLVHGHDFAAYIQQQKADHALRKEQEREERANKKATRLEHETLFGAQPVTPAKRRAAGAGITKHYAVSPTKHQRLESTRLGAGVSQMRAPSPALGRTLRTPLAIWNPAAHNRRPLTPMQKKRLMRHKNASMARTAPGKLTARDVSLASDMSYTQFTRGLRELQAGSGTPALRAALRRPRRRSQRVAGLPPASPAAGTPRRTPRSARLAAPSPRAPIGRSPRPVPARNRSKLGLPLII